MKAQERRHLKQNEFALTTGRLLDASVANRSRLLLWLGAAALVVIVAGAVVYWRNSQANRAGAMLGSAMAIAQAQIAPTSTLPGGQQAGTYPTEQARAEAAIKAFSEVVAAYPNTDAGRLAAAQMASELVAAGRLAEAEAQYRTLMSEPETSLQGALARLGLAETLSVQGKHDEAIKIYTELAAVRDAPVPVDGVLMALARAQLKAGKPQDARATFKRVVDEFPDSPYAIDARQQMTALQ